MSAEIKIEPREGYLFVQLSYQHRFDLFMQHTKQILETCIQKNYSKVLLDVSKQTGLKNIFDSYKHAGYLAEIWDRTIKVAVLVSSSDQMEHKLVENVVQKGGITVHLFSSELDALKWMTIESD